MPSITAIGEITINGATSPVVRKFYVTANDVDELAQQVADVIRLIGA